MNTKSIALGILLSLSSVSVVAATEPVPQDKKEDKKEDKKTDKAPEKKDDAKGAAPAGGDKK